MVSVSRIFLAMVGAIYAYLAIWCSVAPTKTSQLVGFTISEGSGQSEFLVVYGGLEFALAILFLLPTLRSKLTRSSLLACVVVHASLVAFRTVSFFLYDNIGSMTYQLAAGEWLIFLGSAGLMLKMPSDG